MPCRGLEWLLGLLLLLGLVRPAQECGAADSAADGYVPARSAEGVHRALASNLKVAQMWVEDKDFASAAESAAGLRALAHLYSCQSTRPEWRQRAGRLDQACAALLASARAKNAAACLQALNECHQLLDEFARLPTPDRKEADPSFKPQGGTQLWMLLMEGAYTDAKSARTAEQLDALAAALAEEINAVRHLRTEAKWRKMCDEVRDAALQAAATARKSDLDTARKELKLVYQRCEACHQGYKK